MQSYVDCLNPKGTPLSGFYQQDIPFIDAFVLKKVVMLKDH
jgi:hypothetical protein